MNKVRAIAAARFAAGTLLALNERQAGDRKHALRQVSQGVFEATQPVQFKAGEEFGVAGDLPKAMFDLLEGEGVPAPAAAPAAAAPKKPGGKKAAAAPVEPAVPPPAEGEQ